MKKVLYILILIISISEFGCQSITVRDLIVVDFVTTSDQNLEIGKANYKDIFNITVVDFKTVRMFIVPFHNERSSTTLLSNGDVEEGRTTYDTTFVYCLFEKGSKVGLRYDSLTSVLPQKFPVDSLLNRINISNGHLKANSIAAGKLDYSLREDITGKLLEEKFVWRKMELLIRLIDISIHQ
ncbi:hypothetical protein FA048_03990 [Pedobacter polaris]|uniref:Uncharacterized protein n=1 Tax=Pedobacter polaris TaxID=2571273 RepID=A0A4U1CU80_9SPHI|nr:hypothetical protein [Pedobacter polaris]TKC12787.1 hypothetical protein FA048_03990 [Pedobacter polaris]